METTPSKPWQGFESLHYSNHLSASTLGLLARRVAVLPKEQQSHLEECDECRQQLVWMTAAVEAAHRIGWEMCKVSQVQVETWIMAWLDGDASGRVIQRLSELTMVYPVCRDLLQSMVIERLVLGDELDLAVLQAQVGCPVLAQGVSSETFEPTSTPSRMELETIYDDRRWQESESMPVRLHLLPDSDLPHARPEVQWLPQDIDLGSAQEKSHTESKESERSDLVPVLEHVGPQQSRRTKVVLHQWLFAVARAQFVRPAHRAITIVVAAALTCLVLLLSQFPHNTEVAVIGSSPQVPTHHTRKEAQRLPGPPMLSSNIGISSASMGMEATMEATMEARGYRVLAPQAVAELKSVSAPPAACRAGEHLRFMAAPIGEGYISLWEQSPFGELRLLSRHPKRRYRGNDLNVGDYSDLSLPNAGALAALLPTIPSHVGVWTWWILFSSTLPVQQSVPAWLRQQVPEISAHAFHCRVLP